LNSPLASGKLKLVLRLEVLELPLPDRPDIETVVLPPVLEREVLRDDGPEASASIGDDIKIGDVGLLFGALCLPPKSRSGISVGHSEIWVRHQWWMDQTYHPRSGQFLRCI
jgi:hypothetical protein